MISKQAKDFLKKCSKPILKEDSCTLPVEGRPLTISTPPGSDWDTDKIIKVMREQPMYVIPKRPTLDEAIEILCKALEDEDYYRSWSANIAMAFKDEFCRTCTTHQDLDLMGHEGLHIIANNAADNFLKQLMK